MHVVLDANVLVSGLISPQGAPGEILAAWEKDRFDLVVSPATLDEQGRVFFITRESSRNINCPPIYLSGFFD